MHKKWGTSFKITIGGRLEPQASAGGEARAWSSIFVDHQPTKQPTNQPKLQ